jgi:hypothetical protein
MPPCQVMDNYGTHGTPEVKAWLKRHPRFRARYIPTSSSWLNLIERWFARLTSKRIPRESFLSVEDLIAAINEFPRGLEREAQTVCLDGHCRIHRDQTRALPTNPGADPGPLHRPEDTQTEGQLIRGHYSNARGHPRCV